ncbi:DUF222 domain-containing protein [Tsukamurella asaccharolytica]|uniref:DUF222 domain-containing protein n=1 Tax=Tsukamurella asaccharolytica TaxID=2592067 RepID=A0A5C5RAA9_9ACTN|nr:HNH endonuclease signature motif containing protein [Tsukamurella asaccharolytica]TWS19850.1 DUF222 domain-containing protein [Tsukamurella asaccharolytica]
MDLPSGLRELPGHLLPPELAGAAGFRERTADLLFEQRRCENLAFCRTVTTLYSLYRTVYADAEAEYLALPAADATDRELLARRRDLRLREIALNAQVSTQLRLGTDATDRALTEAVGFVERLPQVLALVGENTISVRAGQEALRRSRVLTGEQARRFDELIAERLRRDPLELLAIPAVREAADKIVEGIDPHAAEKRRKRAREDRTVVFRAEDDGMAAAYALLPAEDILEINAKVEEIIETVCDHDPRTVAQRRADGLTARVRGSITLGCQCEQPGCPYREERGIEDGSVDGAIIRYRTLIHVVINETTLAGRNDDAGYLVGHGPVTAEHARGLAARDDAVVREFGERITAPVEPEPATTPALDAPAPVIEVSEPATVESEAAPDAPESVRPLVKARGTAGYRLTADLARYLTLLYPRCVFPMCTRPAARCEIDHSTEYDHHDPAAGGASSADNLQPLCKAHHRLKTAGGWIDARLPDGRILWTSPTGQMITVDPAGTVLDLFPDLRRIDWITPLPAAGSPMVRHRNGPTRLEREHARRAGARAASVALLNDREHPEPNTPQSEFERSLAIAILDFTHTRRYESRRSMGPPTRFPDVAPHPRPPEPAHPDDEPPPF